MSQPRYSMLVARCMKQATSQCDILSQALPGLYSRRLCARCAACLLLSPLRGSVLVTCNLYRVAMKIQCCINVTRALRGIGAARLRSCSPHVRALPPHPYSRGILYCITFRSLHCSLYPWLGTRYE